MKIKAPCWNLNQESLLPPLIISEPDLFLCQPPVNSNPKPIFLTSLPLLPPGAQIALQICPHLRCQALG